MVIRHSIKELLAKSMVTRPMKCIVVNYNNDRCVFIYLSVRNALSMIPLSQVKVSYIPRFYRSQLLKHSFSYYYTIFKLILFQYDTSLSNNFCGIIDQSGLSRLILKQPSFMTARVH